MWPQNWKNKNKINWVVCININILDSHPSFPWAPSHFPRPLSPTCLGTCQPPGAPLWDRERQNQPPGASCSAQPPCCAPTQLLCLLIAGCKLPAATQRGALASFPPPSAGTQLCPTWSPWVSDLTAPNPGKVEICCSSPEVSRSPEPWNPRQPGAPQ